MQEKQLVDTDRALRYNSGKTRYELIPVNVKRELANVYTKGAHKYSFYEDIDGNKISGKDIPFEELGKYKLVYDGSENWRKGLDVNKVLDSAFRHIEQFKDGEDIDEELGTYHLANAMWNIGTVLEQYFIHPELDNRRHKYLKVPKIGLDIDDVLADFIPAFATKYNLSTPTAWAWSYRKDECFADLMSDKDKMHEFFLSLPVRTKPEDIPFEPHCYITSRSIPVEITKQWLEANGFPCAPVYTVDFDHSKVDVAKESGIEIYIDDRYENFLELNNAGICTYLFDCCHNQRYEVGYKRIKEIKDLPFFK